MGSCSIAFGNIEKLEMGHQLIELLGFTCLFDAVCNVMMGG